MVKIKMFLPPREQQREFVHRKHIVDEIKTSQRTSLTQLDTLFASLQYRAFRGEI